MRGIVSKIGHRVSGKTLAVATILFMGAARAASQEAPEAKPRRAVVVSIPDRKLALVENGAVVKVYEVAVGRTATPTPSGDFSIVTRLSNPTYYGHGEIIEPGPENPLGVRWMGVSAKGYGIHGTNLPASIGKAASSGCVRMREADLVELFSLMRVGDPVHIRAERDELVAAAFGHSPNLVAQAGTASPVAVRGGTQ